MQSEPVRRSPSGAFWGAVEGVVVVCFVGMLAVMFLQVLARYALGVGVPWTDETSRFLFIGEIFLGAAIAQRNGAQITITVLLDILPDAARRTCEVASDLLVLAISLGLAWGAWGMIDRTASVMASTVPIPFAVLYAVQGIGILMVGALAARDAWVKCRPSGETPT